MQAFTSPDPTRCPLCGKPNQCAMEVERETGKKQPPCWCSQVKFEPGVFDEIPQEARGKACVCGACASAREV